MIESGSNQEAPQGAGFYSESDTESPGISWIRLVKALRGYRKVMGIGLAAIILLLIVAGLVIYLQAPSHKLATLKLRFDFEGVDRGEYPNGTPFSAAEIITSPIMARVYEVNNLKQYMPFDQFKNSVFILESNPQLDILAREYQAKLSDPRLTTVDRDRIEKEYQKKQESLSMSQYSLNFTRNEYSISMPNTLVSKVLNDILATWAESADQQKGALKYRVPVYSRNIVQKEFIEAEDYVIRVDLLRSKANRIIENVEFLSGLPGATVMRVGKERISLPEIGANLEDLLHFRIEPLIGVIRAHGLSKSPRSTIIYFETRLAQIKLERDTASQRIKTIQDALHQYQAQRAVVSGAPPSGSSASGAPNPLTRNDSSIPALIPQFGESFLDRLIDMTSQNSDVKFRQDLTERIIKEGLDMTVMDREAAHYQDLLSAVKGFSAMPSPESNPGIKIVEAGSQRALNSLLEAMDQINALYDEVSAHNLNPRTLLYTITTPTAITTQRSLEGETLLMYELLALFVLSALLVLGCLVHARFREQALIESRPVVLTQHPYARAANLPVQSSRDA
ncbi:MAG: hypothetical protein HY645_05505 [Acidobacteria bacterium]|nr:hypothetical protein [Acidobacteriota bacterium]